MAKTAKKSSQTKKKSKQKSKRISKPSRQHAKAKHADDASIRIGSQVWPMERNVLFRPDRMKYVRKLIAPEGCVFCTANESGISLKSLCVHQTEHSIVVLNKFPYNSGHLLVLPRQHCGDILMLTESEYRDLQDTVREAMRAILTVYQPEGLNLGLNHGAAAGAGIPEHLHYHLIPRWAGDVNFFPLIAETKVVIESLEISFDRLVGYFKGR